MAKAFSLSVVAPDREVVAEDVTSVIAPGVSGYFGVMADHLPLVAALKPGLLEYLDGNNQRHFVYVGGGFVEVKANRMTVLADEASRATDIDLSRIVAFHEEKGALATIGLTAVENPLEFGIVITNEDGTIERFLEKPGWGQVFSDTVNNGIFVLEPEIFDYIAPDRPVDFSSEVFPARLRQCADACARIASHSSTSLADPSSSTGRSSNWASPPKCGQRLAGPYSAPGAITT